MNSIPDWMKRENRTTVWTEDECAPDAERIEAAWKRFFGVERKSESILDEYDGGDAFYYLYASNRIACVSYPGNSEIFTVKDKSS